MAYLYINIAVYRPRSANERLIGTDVHQPQSAKKTPSGPAAPANADGQDSAAVYYRRAKRNHARTTQLRRFKPYINRNQPCECGVRSENLSGATVHRPCAAKCSLAPQYTNRDQNPKRKHFSTTQPCRPLPCINRDQQSKRKPTYRSCISKRGISSANTYTREAKNSMVQLYINHVPQSAHLARPYTNRNQKPKAKALVDDTTVSTRAAYQP